MKRQVALTLALASIFWLPVVRATAQAARAPEYLESPEVEMQNRPPRPPVAETGPGPTSTQPPGQDRALLDQADKFFKAGDYEKAAKAYKEAIRLQSTLHDQEGLEVRKPEVYYALGYSYFKLGRNQEAVEVYKEAIRLKPDDPRAYLFLGMSYCELHRLQEAVQAFKQAIRLKPGKDMEVIAHCLLARAFIDLGDRGAALEEYKILKNLDSNAANDLFNEFNRTKKKEQAKPQVPPDELGGTPTPSPKSFPAQVPPAASQLIAQAGDSLGGIVNQKYPADNRLGLDALILANPEIDNEDKIVPGQALYLPEIDFPKETIRLKDQRFYAIYGRYQSAASLKIGISLLEKKQVHFVIRDTKGPRGVVVHRVFVGGYETEERLAEALKSLTPK